MLFCLWHYLFEAAEIFDELLDDLLPVVDILFLLDELVDDDACLDSFITVDGVMGEEACNGVGGGFHTEFFFGFTS